MGEGSGGEWRLGQRAGYRNEGTEWVVGVGEEVGDIKYKRL